MDQEASVLRYRKIIITGDILMIMCTGFLYTWSVFVKPLEAEMNWTRPQTSLAYTLATTFNVLGSLLAAVLNKKLKRRTIVQISGLTTFLGFFLASMTSQPWHLYVSYGIIMSASIGMVYNSILVTIVVWFQDKPGTISGVLLMCFGFAGILFNSVANALIVLYGWRSAFLCFGVIFFLLFELFSFCINVPNKEQAEVLPASLETKQHLSANNTTPLNMIKSLSFWLFAFWVITIAAVGLTLSSHASPMAQSLHISSNIAAFCAGLVSFGSGCGRLFAGRMYDKYGLKAVRFSSLLAICGGGLAYLAYSVESPVLLGISFFLTGMGFGGSPVCTTGFVKSTYGESNYGMNLSIGTLPVLVASFIGPYLAGVIFSIAGYHMVCLVLIAYALISLLFSELLTKIAGGKDKAYN